MNDVEDAQPETSLKLCLSNGVQVLHMQISSPFICLGPWVDYCKCIVDLV